MKTNFSDNLNLYLHQIDQESSVDYSQAQIEEIEKFKTSFNSPKDQLKFNTSEEAHNKFLKDYKLNPPLSKVKYLSLHIDNKVNSDLLKFVSNIKLEEVLQDITIWSVGDKKIKIHDRYYEAIK